jgi:hypothetical protein
MSVIENLRAAPMSSPLSSNAPHSAGWRNFTYASFGLALLMVGGGLFFLPVDNWIKGYFAMGVIMLVQSCIAMTKTVRDMHEAAKLVNRIEDARAERLLMEARA